MPLCIKRLLVAIHFWTPFAFSVLFLIKCNVYRREINRTKKTCWFLRWSKSSLSWMAVVMDNLNSICVFFYCCLLQPPSKMVVAVVIFNTSQSSVELKRDDVLALRSQVFVSYHLVLTCDLLLTRVVSFAWTSHNFFFLW